MIPSFFFIVQTQWFDALLDNKSIEGMALIDEVLKCHDAALKLAAALDTQIEQEPNIKTTDQEIMTQLERRFNSLSSPSPQVQNFLRDLRKNEDNLKEIISLLSKPTDQYICRNFRDLMKKALLFMKLEMHDDNGEDIQSLIALLDDTVAKYICRSQRIELSNYLQRLIESNILLQYEPSTDNERFDFLTDHHGGMTSECWSELQCLGVHHGSKCHSKQRMLLISGKNTDNEFFDAISSKWKFDNPRNYFSYIGQTNSPRAQLESGTHIMAGCDIVSVPFDDLAGYKVDNGGTLGAIFLRKDSRTLYAVTAGHCCEKVPPMAGGDTDNETESYENSIFVKRSSEVDIAVIKLKSESIVAYNPPFATFDTTYCSLPVDAHRFDRFSDMEKLEPGTTVIKIGATTGITFGEYVGVASFRFGHNKSESILNGVVIQWKPNTRFTAAGDSGCLYYAIIGCFRYPIAIHRAQVTHEFYSCFPNDESPELKALRERFTNKKKHIKLDRDISDIVSKALKLASVSAYRN